MARVGGTADRKYGGMALVLGRFLPIVRTFAPILSGVVKVEHRIFFVYNVAGAVLWTGTLVTAGYYVDYLFPNALDYLNYIVIIFIVITTIPIVRNIRRQMRSGGESTRTDSGID